jgi:hypothetical protein
MFAAPVLTIGPHVRGSGYEGGHFHRMLFATDFTDASLAAAPFAISLSEENNADVILVHVMSVP